MPGRAAMTFMSHLRTRKPVDRERTYRRIHLHSAAATLCAEHETAKPR